MKSTTHIEATDHSLLFPDNNLIVSFDNRGQAEAAFKNAGDRAVTVIRLYEVK